jgi:hypothetical protein
LRAALYTSGSLITYSSSNPIVLLNQSASGFATSAVGPGQVNLFDGNFELSSGDGQRIHNPILRLLPGE